MSLGIKITGKPGDPELELMFVINIKGFSTDKDYLDKEDIERLMVAADLKTDLLDTLIESLDALSEERWPIT